LTDMPTRKASAKSLLEPSTYCKRNRDRTRFKAYGIAAVAESGGLLMLAILLTTIISRGARGGFQQTLTLKRSAA